MKGGALKTSSTTSWLLPSGEKEPRRSVKAAERRESQGDNEGRKIRFTRRYGDRGDDFAGQHGAGTAGCAILALEIAVGLAGAAGRAAIRR